MKMLIFLDRLKIDVVNTQRHSTVFRQEERNLLQKFSFADHVGVPDGLTFAQEFVNTVHY